MALSKNVKDSLDEAKGNLRSALRHAATSEKPFVIKSIADTLNMVDSIIKYDAFTDSLENKFGLKDNLF